MGAVAGVESGPVPQISALVAEVLKAGSVDPDADFFELGGDSLLAVALVGRMREQVTRDASLRWVFDGRTPRALAELAADAAPPLGAGPLPAAVVAPPPAVAPPAPAAGPEPAADGFLADRLLPGTVVPPTFAQRRVWLFERLHPDSRAYQFCGLVRLRGELDVEALRRALTGLLERHESLRSAFAERDGRPVQVVGATPPLPLEVVDLRGAPARAYGDAIRRAARVRIDPRQAPLVRWTLLRRAGDDWTLVQAEHHLCHDGWSFGVTVDDLAALYAHHAAGAPAPAPPRAQLRDVAQRERELEATGVLDRQLEYWRRVLDPSPEPLALPLDRPRPGHAVHTGGAIRHRVGPDLCHGVRDLARAEGATLFMACLAAHAVQLARLDDRDRVQVGTGMANRRVPAHEDVAGMVINTVALPLDVSGDPTVRELLHRVRETALEAYDNGDVPFDAVVDALSPPRAAGRLPLFETLFSFHDAPGGDAPWPGLETRAVTALPDGTAKADINVIGIDDRDGGMTFFWEHADVLTDATAARLAEQHEHLLRAFVADPDARVSELDVVPPTQARTLDAWERTPGRHDRDATVHGLVLEQAARTPDAVAVRHDGGDLTYAELVAASGALAARLRANGVAPGDRVGILLPRGAAGIVAHLAVVRAGAAYVPLDPDHLAARNARALALARVGVVVTTPEWAGELPDGIAVVPPDGDAAPDPPDLDGGAPGDLAYLMFTSGSTGTPKGVAITLGNIVALVHRCGFADFGPGSVTLHAATTAFDAATFEIWGPLVAGGTVAVLEAKAEPDAIAEAVARHRVTILYMTAGLFHAVVDWRAELLAPLHQVIAGGDVVSAPHARRALAVLAPAARMTDGYGPTEITTFATSFDVPRDWPEDHPLPIGRPLPATACRIVDARGRRTPIGVAGELWVGGDGVAAGYWEDEEQTAARFVVRDGERWYRTGDRAAWRGDGTVEFLGRADNQVKIRGYRVEPGEVEAVLRDHPGIADVAVVVDDLGGGDKRLVAHVVPAAGAQDSPAALRAWATERLPSAMVPAAWPRHERFPLNSSGKVDRRALPAPTREHVAAGADDGDAPRDDLERRLVEIFERVLGVRPVGPRDDFFALGGHSLLALALCDAVERATGRRIAPATVFEAPTPRAMADGLRVGAPRRASSSLVVLRAEGDGAPLACVTAGDGNPLAFASLARRLPPGRPVVTLQPHGIDGRGLLDRDIDAIARRYVEHLRRYRPHGPYLLAGRCNGAAVALAMGHLLREAGEEVPLLAVLDTGAAMLAPAELVPGVARDRTVGSAVGRARRAGDAPPSGGGELAAWMREQPAPGVTRHLAEARRWREDVASAMPDPLGADAGALARWAWASGVAEGAVQPALLAPLPVPGCALHDGRPWEAAFDLVWRDVATGVPEPFSAAGTQAFLARLREPAGPAGVTRYVLAVHTLRTDLAEAFPDPLGADAAALVDWAWTRGTGDGLHADLLGPPPALRSRLAAGRARVAWAARGVLGDPRARRRRARGRAAEALGSAARLAVVAERRLPRALDGATARRHELARRLAGDARARYRAAPWPGLVVHVRSPTYGDAPRYDGWWSVARDVEEVVVDVPHAEMLREPGAAAVAAVLQEAIDAAAPDGA